MSVITAVMLSLLWNTIRYKLANKYSAIHLKNIKRIFFSYSDGFIHSKWINSHKLIQVTIGINTFLMVLWFTLIIILMMSVGSISGRKRLELHRNFISCKVWKRLKSNFWKKLIFWSFYLDHNYGVSNFYENRNVFHSNCLGIDDDWVDDLQ